MIRYSKQIAIWGIGLSMLTAIPAVAQSDNLRSLTLDNQTTSGMMMGSTGGRTSLPAVVSNSDRQNQRCLGFGDPSADHTLVLKRPFSSLSLRVDSGGADTTLLISGPGGVRCADSGEADGDVRLQQEGWEAGTYQIWVGTVTPNVGRDYRLTVRGK
jgi:hypothetical protein